VTSGEFEDCTFVRWTSKFSSDADLGMPPIQLTSFALWRGIPDMG